MKLMPRQNLPSTPQPAVAHLFLGRLPFELGGLVVDCFDDLSLKDVCSLRRVHHAANDCVLAYLPKGHAAKLKSKVTSMPQRLIRSYHRDLWRKTENFVEHAEKVIYPTWQALLDGLKFYTAFEHAGRASDRLDFNFHLSLSGNTFGRAVNTEVVGAWAEAICTAPLAAGPNHTFAMPVTQALAVTHMLALLPPITSFSLTYGDFPEQLTSLLSCAQFSGLQHLNFGRSSGDSYVDDKVARKLQSTSLTGLKTFKAQCMLSAEGVATFASFVGRQTGLKELVLTCERGWIVGQGPAQGVTLDALFAVLPHGLQHLDLQVARQIPLPLIKAEKRHDFEFLRIGRLGG